MMLEEMSELQFWICKFLRFKPKENTINRSDVEYAISEEMADVEIMLEQLTYIFHNTYHIEDYKHRKKLQLRRRIDKI